MRRQLSSQMQELIADVTAAGEGRDAEDLGSRMVRHALALLHAASDAIDELEQHDRITASAEVRLPS